MPFTTDALRSPRQASLEIRRAGLACAKVGFIRVIDLSGFCSGRMVITIQSREAQSGRDATCSVPTAHHVTAQGNALGNAKRMSQAPTGRKDRVLLTPFQGFSAGACFLGRCPRLSHGAALRQNPSDMPAVVTEQEPNQQTTPINITFAQPSPTLHTA